MAAMFEFCCLQSYVHAPLSVKFDVHAYVFFNMQYLQHWLFSSPGRTAQCKRPLDSSQLETTDRSEKRGKKEEKKKKCLVKGTVKPHYCDISLIQRCLVICADNAIAQLIIRDQVS